MSLEDILALIANTGFPVVVASYFIIRMENKLTQLNQSINDLIRAIEKSIL